jgi:hypothetical protein
VSYDVMKLLPPNRGRVEHIVYSITARRYGKTFPHLMEQTMADLYIHQVTNIKLDDTILETNSTRLSTLTITNHQGHKTTINIFFDSDTNYNWKSMTIEDSKDD